MTQEAWCHVSCDLSSQKERDEFQAGPDPGMSTARTEEIKLTSSSFVPHCYVFMKSPALSTVRVYYVLMFSTEGSPASNHLGTKGETLPFLLDYLEEYITA